MRQLNVFFDVDNTIVLWNGKLRNHTREVFERTHRWMVVHDLFPKGQSGDVQYEIAVVH